MKLNHFAVVAFTIFAAQVGEAAPVAGNARKLQSSTRKLVQPKVPKVTADNFVSLTFDVSGGFAGLHSHLVLDRKHMTFAASRRPTITASWTAKERASLFKLLNDARFPALAGTYKQEHLFDGFNETVSLKLRKGKSVQTWTVNNYGDRAPKAYYKVSSWLRSWQTKRFPATGAMTFNIE